MAVSIVAPTLASAQEIIKVAPRPSALDLYGVEFTSALDGWVVGQAHEVYNTRDGGLTWNYVSLPGWQDQPIYTIRFVTPQLGFMVGNSNSAYHDAYRTTDGGTTWQIMPNFEGGYSDIDFVNQNVGFMGSNGALIRTTDQGQSWQLRSGWPDCPIITGMDFVDPNVGLCTGYQFSSGVSGIYKTVDGGLTWQLKHEEPGDPVYLTNQKVITVDVLGKALLSNDGGDTWTPTGAILPKIINDLEKVDSSTVVGVSSFGDVYRSADDGNTWSLRMASTNARQANWNVRFRDAFNGYIVGPNGVILTTSDAGITWTRLYQGIGQAWYGIAAFSPNNVVLVGRQGFAQTTTDGGAHWTERQLDVPTFGRDTLFTDVQAIDSNNGVAVGQFGDFFKTANAGTSWQNLSSNVPPNFWINAVKFTDLNNGWAAGWDYSLIPHNIQRTRDGGLTWEPASLNVPAIGVDFIGDKGWVLTGGKPFWRSSNSGNTWSLVNLPSIIGYSTTTLGMSWTPNTSAQRGAPNIGYVCGLDGYLVRSVDDGATWTYIGPLQPDVAITAVLAVTPSDLWICGGKYSLNGNAFVKHSSNGGLTWKTWNLPGQYTMPRRMAAKGGILYVTGDNGETWKCNYSSSPR